MNSVETGDMDGIEMSSIDDIETDGTSYIR
jgi:hypothetical protein